MEGGGVWIGERKRLKEHGVGMFRHFIPGLVLADCGECGLGLVTTRRIAKGTQVWEADVDQEVSTVLTEMQLLCLPRDTRDNWLEYAWAMSNGYFVGPKLGMALKDSIMMDASCFLNHSSHPCLGFNGDYQMLAIRDIEEGEMVTYDYAMSEWRVFQACEFEDTSFEVVSMKKKNKKNKKSKGKKGKKDDDDVEYGTFRRYVSVDDYKNPDLQERYKGYFLSSVQRLIDLHRAPVGQAGFRELSTSVELKDHPIKVIGKGLFAARDMRKGEMVWRSNGIESVFRKLKEIESADEETKGFYLHYGYQVGENEFSTPPSLEYLRSLQDVASYMNHSCDPTVEIVDSDLWITRRDVKVGEELTYDYAMSEVAYSRLPTCACGTAVCRGKVTKDDYLLPQLRRRYLLSWSRHVLDRIAKEPAFFGQPK